MHTMNEPRSKRITVELFARTNDERWLQKDVNVKQTMQQS